MNCGPYKRPWACKSWQELVDVWYRKLQVCNLSLVVSIC